MTILSAADTVNYGLGAMLMNALINQDMYEYYQSATGTGYYGTYWGGHKSYNYTYYYGVHAQYVGTQNYNSSQWNSLSSANQGAYQSGSFLAGWYNESPINSLQYNAPSGTATPINNSGTYTLVGPSLSYNGTYYTLSAIVPTASITTSNVTQSNSSDVAPNSSASATLQNNGTSTTQQVFSLSTTITNTGSSTTAYGLSAGITASLTEAVTVGNKDVASETTSGTITGSLNANYSTTNAVTTSTSDVYSTSTTLIADPGTTAVAQYIYDWADTYMDWSGPGTLTSAVGNYVIQNYSAQNYAPQFQYTTSYALQSAINYGIPTAPYITPATGALLTGGTVFEGTGYNITTQTYNYSNNSSSSFYVESDFEDSSLYLASDIAAVLAKIKSGISLSKPISTKKIQYLKDGKSNLVDSGWKIDNNLKEISDSTGNDHIINRSSKQYVHVTGGGKDIIEGGSFNDYLGVQLTSNSNVRFESKDGDDVVFIKRTSDDKSHFHVDFTGKGRKTFELDQSVPIAGTKPSSYDQLTLGQGPTEVILDNHSNLHITNFKFGVDSLRWDKSYKISLSGSTFILKTDDGNSSVILRDSVNSLISRGTNPTTLAMLNPEIFKKGASLNLEPVVLLNTLALQGLTSPLRRSWDEVQSSKDTLQSFVRSSAMGNVLTDKIIGKLEDVAKNSKSVDQYWKQYSTISGLSIPVIKYTDAVISPSDLGYREPVVDINYIASYSDLIKAFGNNVKAGIQHFNDYGRFESRKPDLFNDSAYLALNPDVAKDSYFGTRPAEHFVIHGFKEGRKPVYL